MLSRATATVSELFAKRFRHGNERLKKHLKRFAKLFNLWIT
jgi:hypothetical protein